MEKIEILEEKIKSAAKIIQQLREKNVKLVEQYKKLQLENDLLQSENRQVRKLMAELDHLREDRKLIKQKCERLIARYQKMSL